MAYCLPGRISALGRCLWLILCLRESHCVLFYEVRATATLSDHTVLKIINQICEISQCRSACRSYCRMYQRDTVAADWFVVIQPLTFKNGSSERVTVYAP